MTSLNDSLKKGINMELNIYGPTEKSQSHFEVEINHYIIENSLQNKIKYHGHPIENSKIPDLYQKHNLFFIGSKCEGLPNAMLEAMSCGMPVLASEESGAKDLQINKNLIFKAGDVDEISNSIEYLHNDLNNLDVLGNQNRNIAIKHHWKDIANKYKNLYERLM